MSRRLAIKLWVGACLCLAAAAPSVHGQTMPAKPAARATVTPAPTPPPLSTVTPRPAATSAPKSVTPARPMRLGYVDIELIIENSDAIRQALDVVDEQMAEKARAIDAKEREFRRLRYQLDQQERVLAQAERDRRRDELAKLSEEISDMQFKFEKELKERELQMEPVLEKIMAIVADVASRDGYDMVLRGEVVIYGTQSVDLTSAVIDELDKRAGEVVDLFKRQAATKSEDTPTSGTERVPGRRPERTTTGDPLPLIP